MGVNVRLSVINKMGVNNIHNIPPEQLEQRREQLRIPEGTFDFKYTSDNLFNQCHPELIFEITAGRHFYQIIRDQDLVLSFIQANPGSGTRIASVDLKSIQQSKRLFIAVSWTPTSTNLFIANSYNEQLYADGVPAPFKYVVAGNGLPFQISNDVSAMRANFGGKFILKPSAIDSWEEVKKAIGILRKGNSADGYIFESVKSNFCLSALVTGFEVYCLS